MNNTLKERIQWIRFTSETAVATASDNWAEGNLEIYGTILLGGQTPAAFASNLIITRSVDRFAALLSTPNYVENEVKRAPSLLRTLIRSSLDKKVADFKSQNVLTEPSVSGPGVEPFLGLWIVIGVDAITWSPHRYGDLVKYIFMEHDNGENIKITRSYEVGFNASIGKKDESNIGFSGKVAGSTEITYTNTSDDLGEKLITYCQPVGLAEANGPLSTGALQIFMQTR